MLTSPWQQKRAQIAQTMRGSVAPGGLGMGNAGATFRTNPMMGWGQQGAAAPAQVDRRPYSQGPMMDRQNALRAKVTGNPLGQVAPAGWQPGQQQGLMGSTQQGVDPQMARMAQMPGFNYVPPPTGPAPVPQQPAVAGNGAMSMDDVKRLLLGGTNSRRSGGHDGGGYSTSGRGGGRSSSWGGAQRGGGGLY